MCIIIGDVYQIIDHCLILLPLGNHVSRNHFLIKPYSRHELLKYRERILKSEGDREKERERDDFNLVLKTHFNYCDLQRSSVVQPGISRDKTINQSKMKKSTQSF